MSQYILILGFGYTAGFLSKKLAALDFNIIGTIRNPERQVDSSNIGATIIPFNSSLIKKHLEMATHILISTPPAVSLGDPVLAAFKTYFCNNLKKLRWIGYLSSTGVYGDHGGRWVNERSESINLGAQGQLRLDAETAWMDLAQTQALPLHVFRLSGIYGPSRNALLRIQQGQTYTLFKLGHFFSRIHVADIANVLLASMNHPNPLSIYNVSDDLPAASADVDQYAANLLNMPAPIRLPVEQAKLSALMREFYTHNRRVDNTKIKQELGIELQYPTYMDGLTFGC